jgi:hypothetical protein
MSVPADGRYHTPASAATGQTELRGPAHARARCVPDDASRRQTLAKTAAVPGDEREPAAVEHPERRTQASRAVAELTAAGARVSSAQALTDLDEEAMVMSDNTVGGRPDSDARRWRGLARVVRSRRAQSTGTTYAHGSISWTNHH